MDKQTQILVTYKYNNQTVLSVPYEFNSNLKDALMFTLNVYSILGMDIMGDTKLDYKYSIDELAEVKFNQFEKYFKSRCLLPLYFAGKHNGRKINDNGSAVYDNDECASMYRKLMHTELDELIQNGKERFINNPSGYIELIVNAYQHVFDESNKENHVLRFFNSNGKEVGLKKFRDSIDWDKTYATDKFMDNYRGMIETLKVGYADYL